MNQSRIFIFKLAAHLGKTVAEIENTMSINELAEWEEYSTIEPLLPDRIEIMLAKISEMYSTAHFKQKTSVLDYMLSLSKDQKEKIKHLQLVKKLRIVGKRGKNGG